MTRFFALFIVPALACAPIAPAPSPGSVGPATPVELAVRSAQAFDDNASGVISAATLTRWMSDWSAHRPEGLTGDLVILQLDRTKEGAPWLASRDGVRVYHAMELALLLEPRNNGLAAIGRAPGSGVRIDSFMRRFAITPGKDFVLFVDGEASQASLEVLAQAWLTFRYWGHEHQFLGVLNAPVSGLPASLRNEVPLEHPLTGASRIESLREHFSLLADVGAVRAALGKDVIVDVRARAEFEGEALAASGRDDTCLAGVGRCSATFSGRIATAVHFPASALLSDDFTLRTPEALDALIDRAGLDRSRVHVVYDADGTQSALVTFAFLAVAGVPARWYAASFVEWGALNAEHPETGLRALPVSSPWRTDAFPRLTEGTTRWADATLGVRPLIFDPYVTATDRIQTTDAEYRIRQPPLPAVGVGNDPCR